MLRHRGPVWWLLYVLVPLLAGRCAVRRSARHWHVSPRARLTSPTSGPVVDTEMSAYK